MATSEKGQWNHMIAGGLAGSTAVLFLHPFDVIKTRLQGEALHQTLRSSTHLASNVSSC